MTLIKPIVGFILFLIIPIAILAMAPKTAVFEPETDIKTSNENNQLLTPTIEQKDNNDPVIENQADEPIISITPTQKAEVHVEVNEGSVKSSSTSYTKSSSSAYSSAESSVKVVNGQIEYLCNCAKSCTDINCEEATYENNDCDCD